MQAANVGESRHLGFNGTVNSAVRSADPENRNWKPNMKCIGSDYPVRQYGHSKFDFTRVAFDTPILREGEVVGSSIRSHNWKERW